MYLYTSIKDIFMRYIKRIIVFILIMLLFILNGCSKKSSSTKKAAGQNKSSSSANINKNTEKTPDAADNKTVSSGLLLGLRNDDNNTYRTLWISPDGTQVKLKAQGNFILVPYETDFWKIEFKNINYTVAASNNKNQNIKLSRLSSHYAKDSFNYDTFNDDSFKSYTDYSDINKLLFVGNKYVCLERKTSKSSGSESKPSNDNIGVYKINNLLKSPKMDDTLDSTYKTLYDSKISITSLVGNNVHEIIDKYAKEADTSEDKKVIGESLQYKNITNDYTWGIVRSDFKWIPKAAKTWSYTDSNSTYESFALKDAVGFYLPNSVLTYDTVPLNINDIKNAVPDVKDAVSSPSHDMLAVITSNKLLVYLNPKDSLKTPALTINLNGNENIVMDQWAQGSYVSKWDSEVTKYLKN